MAIFATAFAVSNKLNGAKIAELRNMQDQISVDLLSSEMQYSLLSESSCEDATSSPLSDELEKLGNKLSYAESGGINSNEEDIIWLKKNYSLFELRDYLLAKKLAENCAKKPISILYFYSNNQESCPDCEKQGLVLTRLREDYPGLRVYSFDYDLDLSALQTLVTIHKVKDELPALIINRKVYYGFQSIDDVTKEFPELKTLATSTETTKKTTK